MFDQQNYINNYIKNSYESIKVRLRKDNEGNWSYVYTQNMDAVDTA